LSGDSIFPFDRLIRIRHRTDDESLVFEEQLVGPIRVFQDWSWSVVRFPFFVDLWDAWAALSLFEFSCEFGEDVLSDSHEVTPVMLWVFYEESYIAEATSESASYVGVCTIVVSFKSGFGYQW
jgi:hypothetical protein